mmetsp:Transcript_21460/g.44777  ORF Transcript_21460/g.44777 Transcript_21460/m.44777 type:complete len:221 (-) Transcript_21460:104-766(-)
MPSRDPRGLHSTSKPCNVGWALYRPDRLTRNGERFAIGRTATTTTTTAAATSTAANAATSTAPSSARRGQFGTFALLLELPLRRLLFRFLVRPKALATEAGRRVGPVAAPFVHAIGVHRLALPHAPCRFRAYRERRVVVQQVERKVLIDLDCGCVQGGRAANLVQELEHAARKSAPRVGDAIRGGAELGLREAARRAEHGMGLPRARLSIGKKRHVEPRA